MQGDNDKESKLRETLGRTVLSPRETGTGTGSDPQPDLTCDEVRRQLGEAQSLREKLREEKNELSAELERLTVAWILP